MKTRRKIISRITRGKILAESDKPGAIICEVAAKYKISKRMLYTWRSKRKKSRAENVQNKVEVARNNSVQANFVELKVSQVGSEPVAASRSKKLLKKLTLEFEDMSLAIDGKISSKKLMELITVLEGAC
jgi:transposase-like protein